MAAIRGIIALGIRFGANVDKQSAEKVLRAAVACSNPVSLSKAQACAMSTWRCCLHWRISNAHVCQQQQNLRSSLGEGGSILIFGFLGRHDPWTYFTEHDCSHFSILTLA
jgi:hypothetical protein